MSLPAPGPSVLDPTRLCQIELHVTDLERAQAFYAGAFGWQRVPADLHELVVLAVPPGCPFGISLVPRRTAESGSALVVYFATDDPEAVLRQVEAHGGKRGLGPVGIAGYGLTYHCTDPDGTRFGLYVKAPRPP